MTGMGKSGPVMLLCQQVRGFLRIDRNRKVKSLSKLASEFAELRNLFRGFDAFCNDSQSQVAAKRNDGADNLVILHYPGYK